MWGGLTGKEGRKVFARFCCFVLCARYPPLAAWPPHPVYDAQLRPQGSLAQALCSAPRTRSSILGAAVWHGRQLMSDDKYARFRGFVLINNITEIQKTQNSKSINCPLAVMYARCRRPVDVDLVW